MFKNLRGVESLSYLVQTCKDKNMTYQEAVTYFRMYGAKIDEDLRKTIQVDKEERLLDYKETLKVIKSMTKLLGLKGAYKELRDNPKLRETLKKT